MINVKNAEARPPRMFPDPSSKYPVCKPVAVRQMERADTKGFLLRYQSLFVGEAFDVREGRDEAPREKSQNLGGIVRSKHCIVNTKLWVF